MSTTPLLVVLACGLVAQCLLLIPMVPGGKIDTRDFSALPRWQYRGFNVLLTTLGLATLATAALAVAGLAVAAWPALLVALLYLAVFAADLGGVFPVVEDALPVQLLVLEGLSLALAGALATLALIAVLG